MGHLYFREENVMDSNGIREIIDDIVIGMDASSISDTDIFNEIGIDSLDFANILLEIEERYGVSIPNDDVEECGSIQQILDYISK